MRTIPDTQLSRYFTRYNIIEGTAMSQKARMLNWQHIDQYLKNEERFISLCQRLDQVIIDLSAHYRKELADLYTLTLAVSCGFRCLEWEKLQKRSGNSQHTIGAALDVYVITNTLTINPIEVMQYLNKHYWNTWKGGFAAKAPTYDKQGKLRSIGFLHFDNRPFQARWHYQ